MKEQYCFDMVIRPAPFLKYWRPWSYGRQHFEYQWCSTCILQMKEQSSGKEVVIRDKGAMNWHPSISMSLS